MLRLYPPTYNLLTPKILLSSVTREGAFSHMFYCYKMCVIKKIIIKFLRKSSHEICLEILWSQMSSFLDQENLILLVEILVSSPNWQRKWKFQLWQEVLQGTFSFHAQKEQNIQASWTFFPHSKTYNLVLVEFKGFATK